MRKSIIYSLLAFGAILFAGVRLEAGVLEAFDCIDTFDNDLHDCMTARSICHLNCGISTSCHNGCESAYSQCLSRASSGGALGIPQGFNSCLNDALYEEPMLQTDIDNLWTQCMNGCFAERSYCLAQGDQMNPTPENWDEGCYSMGIDCTVACMDIGPLSF